MRRHAARLCDFSGDFCRRQNAAMAGLCALTQFHLDHLDLRIGGLSGEFLRIELSLAGATAEITAADLPDKIAAEFAVIGRDAALARVMRETAKRSALVERPDGIGAQ